MDKVLLVHYTLNNGVIYSSHRKIIMTNKEITIEEIKELLYKIHGYYDTVITINFVEHQLFANEPYVIDTK